MSSPCPTVGMENCITLTKTIEEVNLFPLKKTIYEQ